MECSTLWRPKAELRCDTLRRSTLADCWPVLASGSSRAPRTCWPESFSLAWKPKPRRTERKAAHSQLLMAFFLMALRGRTDSLLAICPVAYLSHGLRNKYLALAENRSQPIFWVGCVPAGARRTPDAIAKMEGQASALGRLVVAFDGIFEHVAILALDGYVRALESKLLGVAIQLLEKRAAHAEGDVVGRPAGTVHRGESVLDRPVVNAIALNHANFRVQHAITLAVGLMAKLLSQNFENLQHYGTRIAGIGTNHERPRTPQHFLFQQLAPELFTRLVNVVGVADYRDQPLRKLGQHIVVSPDFVFTAPGGNGGMFRRRYAEAFHVARFIVFLEDANARDRVRAFEVDQMARSADAGRLFAGNATIAEVVKLEVDQRRIARSLESRKKHTAYGVGQRRHGHRVPDFHQQRLQVVGEPPAPRVGVLDGHQNVLHIDNASLFHGLDHHRKPAAVLRDDVPPAGGVEQTWAQVPVNEALRLGDVIFVHHTAAEVLLQVVLQAEEERLAEHPAARFQVAVYELRSRRILLPMSEFVTVGLEDQVARSGADHGCVGNLTGTGAKKSYWPSSLAIFRSISSSAWRKDWV